MVDIKREDLTYKIGQKVSQQMNLHEVAIFILNEYRLDIILNDLKLWYD